MEETNLAALTTLGHAGRMSVFRLLMRRYPDAVRAGDLARALDLKPSTLSVYLSALLKAGLVVQLREGTSRLYRVEMGRVTGMMEFLLGDCCRGRPALCPTDMQHSPMEAPHMPRDSYNVLFICTGNSARSIFAETLLRELAGDRFTAFSAGTKPYSELNPIAVTTLRDKGHDVSGLRAKNVDEFRGPDAPRLDFVFTVCDLAANEECPPWEGQPITAHWGVADPVAAEGTEAEKALAFQRAYGELKNRITAFVALPLDTLDRVALQAAVDHIAEDTETA